MPLIRFRASAHPGRRLAGVGAFAAVLLVLLGRAVGASGETTRTLRLTWDPAQVAWSPGEGGIRPDLPGGAHVAASGFWDLPLVPVPVEAPPGLRLVDARVVEARRVPLAVPGTLARVPAGAPASGAGRWLETDVTVAPLGHRRGQRVDALLAAPLRAGASGALELTVSLTLELRFGPDRAEGVVVPRRAPETAVEGIAAAAGPTERPSLDGSPVSFLIVTGAELLPELQRLADWRTRTGTRTAVRTMDWVLDNYRTGVDDAENLRLFLRDAFVLWGTEAVLLGGDSEVVPIRYGHTTWFGGERIPTDLYFQCLDGSWNGDGDGQFGEGTVMGFGGDDADILPELNVGRFPVTTRAQAANVVDKILAYESAPPVDDEYPASALLLAEVLFPQEWTQGVTIFQDGAEYAEVTESLLPDGFRVRKYYENWRPYENAEPESVATAIREMNRGYGIVHHVGHGFHDNMSMGLGDASIRIGNVDALHNQGRPFLLYSINCTSSAVDLDAIGEHFLYNPAGGAVASVGSTRYDFPGTSQVYDEAFYRALFPADGSPGPPLGEAATLSKVPFASLAIEDRTHRWTYFTLMYFGDPLLRVWSAPPQPLNAVHPSAIPLGEVEVPVRVTGPGGAVAGARVTLSKAGETFATGLTDASGDIRLRVRPLTIGPLLVTATGRDGIPYTGSLAVGNATGPYLVLDGWSVGREEETPRPGGALRAGESTEIEFFLANGGSASLAGLSASAAAAEPPGLTFSPVSLAPAALAPGQAAVLRVGVEVPAGVPDGSTARVVLTASAGAASWTIPAPLEIVRPRLEVYELAVTEVTGDGDGAPEPGETVDLAVTLLNRGSAVAVDAAGLIAFTTAGNGALLREHVVYGAIPPGETGSAAEPFRIRVGTGPLPVLSLSLEESGVAAGERLLDLVAPPPPGAFEAAGERNDIRITWSASGAADLARYVVVRSDSEEGPYARISGFTEFPSAVYVDRGLPDLAVRFYRVAAQDGSGNLSAFSPPVRGTTSLPRVTGFPLITDQGSTSTPVAADLDADGVLDVFVGGHQVFGFHADGTELVDGDRDARTLGPWSNRISEFGWWGSPAVGDLDGDGRLEVVGTTAKEGEVYVWDGKGNVLPGWPRNTGPVDQSWALSSPTLADLTGDGLPEIVLHSFRGVYAFDRFGDEVRDGDGNPATRGVFFDSGSPASYASVAAADFDDDGRDEIVFPTRSGLLYLVDDDGTPMPGFPRRIGESVSSPALADLDGDGDYEIVFGTRSDSLEVFHHDGTRAAGWPRFVFLNDDIQSSPAVGDLDGDGTLEIAIVAANTTLLLFRPDGTLIRSVRFRDASGNSMPARGSPSIANLDEDDDLEVVFTNQVGWVYAIDLDGSLVPGFPLKVGGAIEGGVLVEDLDGDGMNELAFAGFDRQISVYHTLGHVVSRPTWSTFQHDAAHTGRIDAPVTLSAPPRLGLAVLQSPQIPETAGVYAASTWALDGPPTLRIDGVLAEAAGVPGDARLYRGHLLLDPGSHVLRADAVTVTGAPVSGERSFDVVAAPGADGWWTASLGPRVRWGSGPPPVSRILVQPAAGAAVPGLEPAGATWLVGPPGLAAEAQVTLPVEPGRAGAAVSVWTGAGWEAVPAVAFAPGAITVATPRLGWFRVEARDRPPRIEPTLALLAAGPNPFARDARLAFRTGAPGRVTVDVFDVRGRRVRGLLDAELPGGDHEAVWDGHGGDGAAAAPGIYFVRVAAAGAAPVSVKLVRLGEGR